MKKIIPCIILFILLIGAWNFISDAIYAGGDYKTYQNRSLTTFLRANTDLSRVKIKHLVELSRKPSVISSTGKMPGDSVTLGGEWLLFEEETGITVHCHGSKGIIVVNPN